MLAVDHRCCLLPHPLADLNVTECPSSHLLDLLLWGKDLEFEPRLSGERQKDMFLGGVSYSLGRTGLSGSGDGWDDFGFDEPQDRESGGEGGSLSTQNYGHPTQD